MCGGVWGCKWRGWVGRWEGVFIWAGNVMRTTHKVAMVYRRIKMELSIKHIRT